MVYASTRGGSPGRRKKEGAASVSPEQTKDPIIELQHLEAELRNEQLRLQREFEEHENDRRTVEIEALRGLQQRVCETEAEDTKLTTEMDRKRRAIHASERSIRSAKEDIVALEGKIKSIEEKLGTVGPGQTPSATSPKADGSPPLSPRSEKKKAMDAERRARLLADVETVEQEVLAAKSHYSSSRGEVQQIAGAVAEKRGIYEAELKMLRELEGVSAEYQAMQSNVHAVHAKAIVEQYTALDAEAAKLTEDIDVALSEKQLMLQHLLQGVKQRHDTLKELRSRFIPLKSDVFASLFKENVKQRDNLASMYLTIDAEMQAMQSFHSVLHRRCETAAERIHRLSFELELEKSLQPAA